MLEDTATAEDQQTAAQAAAEAETSQAEEQARSGSESETTDPELARLQKELADVRKEAAASRIKLKQFEDAQLSETQRLEQERDEKAAGLAKAEARARDLQVQVLAGKLGVRPDAADLISRLIDWDQIQDTTDDKQVERAIRELVKERPYLSGRGEGLQGGADRNGRGAPASMTDTIRQMAGRR